MNVKYCEIFLILVVMLADAQFIRLCVSSFYSTSADKKSFIASQLLNH